MHHWVYRSFPFVSVCVCVCVCVCVYLTGCLGAHLSLCVDLGVWGVVGKDSW